MRARLWQRQVVKVSERDEGGRGRPKVQLGGTRREHAARPLQPGRLPRRAGGAQALARESLARFMAPRAPDAQPCGTRTVRMEDIVTIEDACLYARVGRRFQSVRFGSCADLFGSAGSV